MWGWMSSSSINKSLLYLILISTFAPGKGKTKFLLVEVDYFTKWIESEPLAFVSAKNVQNFVWRSIVVRCATHNNNWQWLIVHRPRAPIFLWWPRYQVHNNLGRTPTDQRAGRGCQQNHLERNEEAARQSKRSMDRRTVKSPMGISLHP